MHKFYKIYYFIDKFNRKEIERLNKNITLIYRNYKKKCNLTIIKQIKMICDKQKRDFLIANHLKVAKKLNLSGVYIPSFNKLNNYKNLSVRKKFEIIGSAHNIMELKNKENQGCKIIFLAPIFKTNKSYFFLGITRFNLISLNSEISKVALGGINSSNISKIQMTKAVGFASISWIKKNRPKTN